MRAREVEEQLDRAHLSHEWKGGRTDETLLLLIRVFGWLAAFGWAGQRSQKNTGHMNSESEQYFSLTPISRNSILAYFSVMPNRLNIR